MFATGSLVMLFGILSTLVLALPAPTETIKRVPLAHGASLKKRYSPSVTDRTAWVKDQALALRHRYEDKSGSRRRSLASET